MDLSKYSNCKAHKQWLFITNEVKPIRPCCYFKTDYDAENLTDYRRQLATADIEKNCSNCIKQEAEGNMYSQRYMLERRLKEKDYWLTVSFDNLCDMKCIYCSPLYSSQIYAESVRYGANTNMIEIVKNMPDNLAKKIWLMKEFFLTTDFDKVNFTILGGEPLLNPKVYEFLDWLIKQDFAKKVTLTLFSNGKVYHDDLWKYTDYFAFTTLTFSIDGTGDTFEYIRFGGKYPEVKYNIDLYYAQLEGYRRFGITLSYAVSWMNAINFAEWFNVFSKDFPKIGHIHMNKLVYPEKFSIDLIPVPARQEILDKIASEINLTNANAAFIEAYEIWKTFLTTGPDNSSLLEEAIQSLELLDKRRDINYRISFDKILKILNNHRRV